VDKAIPNDKEGQAAEEEEKEDSVVLCRESNDAETVLAVGERRCHYEKQRPSPHGRVQARS
jgi:hypothetical protein